MFLDDGKFFAVFGKIENLFPQNLEEESEAALAVLRKEVIYLWSLNNFLRVPIGALVGQCHIDENRTVLFQDEVDAPLSL